MAARGAVHLPRIARGGYAGRMKMHRRRPSATPADPASTEVAEAGPATGFRPIEQGMGEEEQPCMLGSGGPVEQNLPPGAGETAFRVAESLYAIHAWSDAAEKYEEAWLSADVTPDQRGSIAFNLGQCYRKLKQPQAAVAWFKSARARGRKDADKQLEALASSKVDEQTAFAESGMSAEARFQEAEAAYGAGRWAEAAVGYREAFASPGIDDAQKGEIAYNLGQCCRKQSQWRQARTWYTRARDLGAKAAIDANLAECQAHLGADAGEEDEALVDAQSAFDEAEQLYEKKQYAKAKLRYLDVWASGLTQDQGPIAFNIGQCCRHAGDFAEAWGWYEEALSAGGSTVKQARVEIKRIQDQAADALTKAKPDKAEKRRQGAGEQAMVDRGAKAFDEAEANYQAGKYREARVGYQRLWELGTLADVDRSVLAFNVAQCFRMLGEKAAAAAWYDEAVTLGGLTKADVGFAKSFLAEMREPAWAKAS